MTSSSPRIWFITGISRGLGRALAEEVRAQGDHVVGTTRDGTSDLGAGVHAVPLDLSRSESPATAVRAAHAVHGRLDVVVNNAGYGLLGPIEETRDAEATHLFEVNFFGALRVLQAALPLLRAQGAGHVVNISSIAALAPMAGSGVYAASKAALSALSESLALELVGSGVRVTSVEPGAFRTDFLSPHSLRRTEARLAHYEATSGEAVRALEKLIGQQGGDPRAAARALIQAVRAPEPPLHLVLGADAVGRTRAKLERLGADVSRWEEVSRATGFPRAD
ncbi:SDR family NAD(P)-dependent oxidoreductase [Archangium primigenium]|uniref:SDR family NAD(P)-dependent oxidoreductase n=1 Tax=[Archangium] primigenium TaxID=2792470 RepID=UPI00195E295C|nr:SDR family NAD(P)-dependent oxidoreductase [Archangium primigenium]MBM7112535.1 SDR family NAD(P)-dependent oxidoreductase [Archangium primigenium]